MVVGLQNKKIAFIIQARMQSARLPGKILMALPFGGTTSLLGHIIESLQKSISNYSISVATSTNVENDVLAAFCKNYEVNCYRGSENDVLSRFMAILDEEDCDLVVRLTADNPFVDIELLDAFILKHIESGADYSTSEGLPLGMNFEIVSAPILKSLTSKSLTDQEKEHVTLYIVNSGLYTINVIKPAEKKAYKVLRLTVDYPSDYMLASALFTLHLSTGRPLGLSLIDYCLEKYPWLFEINQSNLQKGNYATLEEELEYVKPVLEQYEFKKVLSLLASKQLK